MATFPRLSTNAVAQFPSSRHLATSTSKVTYVDCTEQTFRNYSKPVRRWILQFHLVTPEEMLAIEEFWTAQQGPTESFSFIDPWDGVEYSDCSFEAKPLEAISANDGRLQSSVVIRCNEV